MSDDLTVVTGAAGFIGSNLASSLAAAGANIVVCDKFTHDESWQYLAPLLIHDIVMPDQLLAWLCANRGRVAAIVHMGAISATTETDVVRMIANNIRFTLDLWTFAAQEDIAFVYASSAATYGDGSAGFVDDDSPSGLASLRPLNLYGWSKHLVDRRIIDDVEHSRPAPRRWAGLKFFNVYGPNEAHKGSMRSVVHQIYPVATQGQTVHLFKSDAEGWADGGQMRDFIYVKDCCEIVSKLLRAPAVSGIYNVGTGIARTFEDLAKAVFLAAGQAPKIEYIDMPPQLRDRYQYFTQADTSKLTAASLAPDFHTLESGILDYVTSHLAQELGAGFVRS